MFDSIFEFLFKYRPLIYEQGDFAFRGGWAASVAVAGALVAGLLTLRTYSAVKGNSRPVDRHVLAGIRLAALAVLVVCLFRPVLILSSVVPQQNFLGVLIDDSRSMQITDLDGQARASFVAQHFGPVENSVRAALADRFAVRFFRFSSTTDRLDEMSELTFSGTQTRLGQALDRAREELAGVPLSGLVVVSDGADNSEGTIAESLLPLQAAGVPVFTVGVGRETFERDIQLSRVETPRTVLKGASLAVDVVVTQTGYRGRTVTVQVEDEGRIVGSQDVELPADGEPKTARLRFTAGEDGPRLFTFRVTPQADEMVTQNNVREALIVVRDRREKILYFEGEPRFEVKFVRRAVSDDENLQVSVLQRTAENKFLRLGVDGPEDLAGGFPKTRAELFKYRGLILGSIEANHFTPDQLRMILDFVSERGGGLLMLGSHRSFGEGGYAGTPVADVLPVVIANASGDGEDTFFTEIKVRPTRAGAAHAATQIADTEEASVKRWRELPSVTIVNPVKQIKPGATTLLTSEDEEYVALAFQRFGAGKTLAFPIQDSWMWQMHVDIPVEDMTHETLWRRLLRWLIDGVPDQVVAALPKERVEPAATAALVAEVSDENFVKMNSATVAAVVTTPAGEAIDLPMEWMGEQDGEYRASYTPTREGFYEVRVEATTAGGTLIGEDVTYLRVAPSDNEYYDSTMRAPLLKRVADETGGRFYTSDTVDALAEDIRYVGRGVTVIEERELWDMPALLFLLMLLVLGEWGYRRARGLA